MQQRNPAPDLFSETPNSNVTLTHREKWLLFHRANPHVYKRLRDKARRMKATGRSFYSINTLYHAMRFDHDLDTDDESFKLNNNHAPFYARLLMLRCPDLDGFFEVRVQRSANRMARDGSMEVDYNWRDDPFWKALQFNHTEDENGNNRRKETPQHRRK